MPAIRDTSWAYETLTTDGGVSILTPNNSTNDLLIAFVMGDTGAPTWTLPSGWTQLFATNNTVSTLCAYKISNGSEPSSLTFGATVAETYNGAIISIRDVDTTNPFGSPSVFNSTTQVASAKFNMQSITTNQNDALCLVFSANSSAGVPSFIEGIAHSLVASDGSAESMGIGWFFQKTAGATPSTISCSNVASGAGVKAVIQIAPPSGGATIIPTYVAQDNCTYLDPINGITAYNTNTALSATADTGFGTSLGGITAADATVAAATDTGLNSFHSTGQLTTVANGTTTYGAELVFAVANRPGVTGKNILCHIQSSTAGQNQRLTNIASNKGAWMGIRSSSLANYKIWQVLGVDSPNAEDRRIPIVINESAINTKASNGTLSPASILAVGFWIAGTQVGATVWQVFSLWLMDLTVVAGGNATEPMDLAGIYNAIAKSHERRSASIQGTTQMLLLQDLQIGNGGANPVYANLSGTAIELPSQYNPSTKQVSYNSVDNKIGITYYLGASDTIIQRNATISSASRYKWGLHASSSPLATYDFKGLQVIGAGVISLAPINPGTVINGLTIDNYVSISAAGVNFVECIFRNVPTSTSITSNASTTFSACKIDVSLVTAGNWWHSLKDPSIFSSCAFTGGGGHAIRITTPGTYSFSGNTFTGFGANGSTGASIYNDSGGLVTLNITGGGNTPTVRNGAGASTIVNSSVTLTIEANTSLVGAEIRIYDMDNTPAGSLGTELSGVESHTLSTYTYAGQSGNQIWIQIMKTGYEEYGASYTLGTSDSTLPVLLVPEVNS